MNIRAGQRVEVSKYCLQPGDNYNSLIHDGLATFQAWGMSFEEFETGAGNYSTAIIVRDDGSVENPSVEMIKFINEVFNAK